MAAIARLRAAWAGSGIDGPGVSTFYFDPSDTGAADAVHDFFQALNPVLFPSGLTITVPPNGDIIDDATGVLSGSWNDPGTGGVTTGTATTDFARGVGFRVVWNTSGIFRGRRVRGSTFIVPIQGGVFSTSGLLDPATVAATQAAADALVGSGVTFKVWSRPVDATPGESNDFTSATAPNKVSWLRSRRV